MLTQKYLKKIFFFGPQKVVKTTPKSCILMAVGSCFFSLHIIRIFFYKILMTCIPRFLDIFFQPLLLSCTNTAAAIARRTMCQIDEICSKNP